VKIGWAIVGVIFPAAAILALTLVAALNQSLQGMLLTVEILGFFIGAMMLMPRIPTKSNSFWGISRTPVTAQKVEPKNDSAEKGVPPKDGSNSF
jgi:hypothetical protein